MEFSSFGLHPDLLRGVTDLGFTRPTPIQEQALPAGLAGKDLLAAAQTGSGKTAAFLLPILQRLIDQPRGRTRALILTPTRELAAQIHEHFEALAKYTRLRGAAVFGGVGMGPQEQAFRTGVDVIIATPGRLLDHFQNAYARLDSLEVLVLDEADRMLDMGFLPDIRRVLRHIPAKRQTLFFSATMPAPIVELSRDMLRSPEAINIERKQAPATGVAQALYPVTEELKAHLFLELLKRGEIGNVIVFTRTKHRANRLSDFLEKHGVPNARIHGNRSQAQRTEALAGFKNGRFRVLVATDIVARGIDVEALEHVVNFDVPHLPEDYIHRVGRTARKDATGDAYTFVSPDEERDLKAIERAVGKAIPRRVVEGFDYRNKPVERFEVPIQERIAEIRARKAEERARAKAKADRKAQREAEEAARVARGGRPSGGDGGRRPQPQGQSQSSSSQGEGGGRRRSRGGRGRAGAGSGGPR
ncbi:MAG: DEAD/DEAH box helicase [Longimicrobiaceae bacterium]